MKRLLVFTVALAALLLVLGSKGAIGGVALAMLTIAVRWRQLPYLVLLVPGAWFLVESQMSALVMDFEEFTSAATRLGLAVTALIGLAHDPFGYGYYGFYGAVQKYGVVAMNWLTSIVPVNISELQTIVEDLVAVSTKSTLLDFCLTLGGFFVLFLWQMVRLIDLWDPRARVCMAYFLLLALTNSGHASITFFLGWLVMIRGFPRREAFVRSRRRSRWARWLQHLLGQGRSRPADLVPVPTGRDA